MASSHPDPARLAAAAALGAAFCCAIFYKGGGANLAVLAYGVAALGAGFVAMTVSIARERAGTWSRAHAFAAAWLGLLALLTVTSTLRENSLLFACVLGSSGVVFLVTSQLGVRANNLVMTIMIGAGLVSACWGIADYVRESYRASGPIIDPNAWAALQNLLFFTVLSRFVVLRGRAGWALLPVLIVFAAALAASYSRVGTAVLIAALGFVVILGSVRPGARLRLAAAAIVTTAAILGAHGWASQEEASHAEGFAIDTSQKGWTQRLAMWEAGGRMAADYPLFGTGPGTFTAHYPRYRTAADVHTVGNFVHNDYIQFLAEGGPLMLAFLLAFAAWLVLRLVRSGVAVWKGDLPALEQLVLVVGMGTVLTHSLMNFALYQLPVQMLLGLLSARLLWLGGERSLHPLPLARPLVLPVAAGLTALLLTATLMADAFSYGLVYDQRGMPFVAAIKRDESRYFETMHFLNRVRSGNSTNRVAMATLYRQSMDRTTDPRARHALGVVTALEYQAGLALNPFRFRIMLYLADLLEFNPELGREPDVDGDAAAWLARAIATAPIYPEPRLMLASRLPPAERYEYIKETVWPWVDLRHGGWEERRLQVCRMLLAGAVARGDRAMLQAVLAKLSAIQAGD